MRIEELVNRHYSKLNPNDLHILKYILSNKETCCNLGINELANRCNVSRTTVLRLTQKLGLSGYSEFKIFLKWQDEEEYKNIEENNYMEDLVTSISDTIKYNKDNEIKKICKLIHEAERVFVYGTGVVQQTCARELKRMFLYSHKYFNIIDGKHEFESLIPNITNKDVVIIISLSGNTPGLDVFTNQMVLRGIDIVSITKLENNRLASITPYNIYGVNAKTQLHNNAEYESVVFFFVIMEIIFNCYKNYVKEVNTKLGVENAGFNIK